jgi:hypothetical protein
MEKIAHRIEIGKEIKIDEEGFEYKDFLVYDELGELLEEMHVSPEVDYDNYFEKTGVLIGFSKWILD